MLMTPFAMVALTAYLCSCLRLLAYRKDGARHRRSISWLAWMLLVVMAGSAVEILMHAHAIGFFEAARSVLFFVFINFTRGNVASLLRSE